MLQTHTQIRHLVKLMQLLLKQLPLLPLFMARPFQPQQCQIKQQLFHLFLTQWQLMQRRFQLLALLHKPIAFHLYQNRHLKNQIMQALTLSPHQCQLYQAQDLGAPLLLPPLLPLLLPFLHLSLLRPRRCYPHLKFLPIYQTTLSDYLISHLPLRLKHV